MYLPYNYIKEVLRMAKHSSRRSTKKIITMLLAIILICSVILIAVIKVTDYIDNKKQEDVSKVLDTIDISSEDITPEQTARMLQVSELKSINEEVMGWLEIQGTNISYPVLQGEDNEYYLSHNYKKEEVSGGSIFLDKDYDFNKPSENLLIYGHRNTKGLMFEDLVKYKDEDFYKEHQTIRFTTTTNDSEYEIIAVFNSRVYYQDETNVFRYYYFINAESEIEYNNYVNEAKKASIYNIEKTATYGDQLLTLSTCDYSQKDGRFAVVARKITE
jgi:sortase B